MPQKILCSCIVLLLVPSFYIDVVLTLSILTVMFCNVNKDRILKQGNSIWRIAHCSSLFTAQLKLYCYFICIYHVFVTGCFNVYHMYLSSEMSDISYAMMHMSTSHMHSVCNILRVGEWFKSPIWCVAITAIPRILKICTVDKEKLCSRY